MNAPGAARWAGLDAARGLAVLAMIGFHLIWDLGHFGYVDANFSYSTPVKAFGHAIAFAFLFIAGVSLALAHEKGLRWGAFWRRFAVVAGAAALVTLGTYVVFPGSYVFFGILHCIAAASLLAAPFLAVPWPFALAAALCIGVAPLLFSHDFFNAPWLQWLGLSTGDVLTYDYRPLLPWSGALLLGLAATRAGALPPPPLRGRAGEGGREPLAGLRDPLPQPLPTRGRGENALIFLGRHSLIIYLAHQPLLFALFSALALVAPGNDEPASFIAACEKRCVADGGAEEMCRVACACIAQETARGALVGATGDAERSRRLNEIARGCVAKGK